jgi:hypothetical protein
MTLRVCRKVKDRKVKTMKKSIDLSSSASRFQAVSVEEQMLVEGGGILSSIWGAIKDAASWVVDNVFVDLGNWVFGWKGTW